MKNLNKLKLFTVLLLLTGLTTTAQITKGNWMVGGIGYYSSDKYEFSPNDTETVTHFAISPNIGYFIIDNFSVGTYANYSFDKNASSDIKFSHYNFGPFIRYYFLKPEKQVNYFLQTSYIYEEGWSNNRNDGRYHNNGYGLRAGMSIFFNESVALELALDYNVRRDNSSTDFNSFKIGLGFQIHLEK